MEILKENIKEISLLTLDDFNKCKSIIPAIQAWWWLKTNGAYTNKAAYVFIDGDAYAEGYNVNKDRADVRPLIIVDSKVLNGIGAGDKVTVGKFSATVLNEESCLLDECVCKHRFDEKSGNYETSEIKAFIESEEFLNMIF